MEVAIGKNAPRPAPVLFMESLLEVEVTHGEEGGSGFQITLQGGRCDSRGRQDYPLLESGLLEPFNRVLMTVTIRSSPQILMDGIITHHQLLPDEQNQESSIVVTGEDVSVMMDMEERSAEHSGMDEATIARRIISESGYSQYGLVPEVSDPPVIDAPDPNERTPVQQTSDLEYLRETARRFGYVFYITPGQSSGQNIAYWGPPRREDQPQRSLSVNMGPNTNVESINFRYNALSPTKVAASVQDRGSNDVNFLETSARSPSLSKRGMGEQAHVRSRRFRQPGMSTSQISGRIQGMDDASSSQAATAEGELDALCYGGLLWPHRPVALRGAGRSYDGLWHVKQVTHVLRSGEGYKQRFVLTREGLGTTIQKVNTERG